MRQKSVKFSLVIALFFNYDDPMLFILSGIYLPMNIKIVAVVAIFLFSQFANATKVILILPDQEGPKFWNLVDQVSAASAKSLGMQLEVIYGGHNRFSTLEIIK